MGQTRWVVDAVHSSAEFEVQHMAVSVFRNRFRTLSGAVTLDEGAPAQSSLEATIDLRSIDVAPGRFLDTLYSPAFFDVEKEPTMRFVSQSVSRTDATSWKVSGTLTLRGASKPLELTVTDRGGGTNPFSKKPMRSFHARGELNRADYGLTWNATLDTGAAYLGERVTIDLNLELVES